MIRRPITLIELFVALTLISLIGGVVAVNVRFAYLEQQFRSEVDWVVQNLRLAQEMMLLGGIDCSLYFRIGAGQRGLLHGIETQDALPERWQQIFKRRERPLTAIHVASFSEKPDATEITVHFWRGEMSRGTLYLSTHRDQTARGATTRQICLPGYPAVITAQPFDPDSLCPPIQGEEERQLTELTIREVLEYGNETAFHTT